jgi:S-DNA-T family DNA segregation ATPase FtsK/SpoIIIE
MQTLGLASIMLILPISVWGWRMVSHRDFDSEPLRFGCWVLCVAIAAGFASCWPRNREWPLPTGFGGVVGDALVGVPIVVFGSPGRIVLGIILGAVMIATFMVASGMGSRPPEESSWF